MRIVTLTQENFEETVNRSELPVLVDFWAPWCSYCRRLEPTLAALADERDGQIVIAKLNIDDEPELTDRFEVDTIPTLLMFNRGKYSEAIVAPSSKSIVDDWIDSNI